MSRRYSRILPRFDDPRLPHATVARLARSLFRAASRRLSPVESAEREALPLLAWSQKFLPHYATRPPSRMHRWLEEQLDRMVANRGAKLNVVGPRGSAKSTIGALAWPLKLAVEGSEPYIWLVSCTKDQAAVHLDHIKGELIDNPALAATYPAACGQGRVWRRNRIVMNNEVAIDAFGAGQGIRGRRMGPHRPSLVICDDLQSDQHIHSPQVRELGRQWFHGSLLKAGNKRTNFVHLATALHHDALAMELLRTAGWNSEVFRAIERWPDNMPLWRDWETIYTNLDLDNHREAAQTFFDRNRAAMETGAELLWPEEENLYSLMCMRVESGHTAFEREKQGSPVNPEMCEWPDEYFAGDIWFTDWPAEPIVKMLALDPSKGSDSQQGDYSALVMLAVDRRGMLYVDADLARRPTPKMIADAVECVRRFQPTVFGIEANQFQELLAPIVVEEFQRRGMVVADPWLIHNTVSKQVRIRRLGPYLSMRRVRFKANSPSVKLLVQQLIDFPQSQHDDGPDALEMALRMATEWLDSNRAARDGPAERIVLNVD